VKVDRPIPIKNYNAAGNTKRTLMAIAAYENSYAQTIVKFRSSIEVMRWIRKKARQ
jgi:hypothetical protein